MTSAEEQPRAAQAPADEEHRQRPPREKPLPDRSDAAIGADEDGDVAPEHNSLTVGNDPLDKPAESDSR